jgi:hypothetical protein
MLVHLDDMVFLAARGRRRPNDCFGVGALCRTRPKSEQLRIRAALIVWARVAFVEPNDDARATTPDAKVEKGRRQGELLRRYWQPDPIRNRLCTAAMVLMPGLSPIKVLV